MIQDIPSSSYQALLVENELENGTGTATYTAVIQNDQNISSSEISTELLGLTGLEISVNPNVQVLLKRSQS